MLGHGRPHLAPAAGLPLPWVRIVSALCTGIAVCCCAFAQPAAAQAAEMEVGLRITWGGGQRRLWNGSIRVDRGRLSEPRRLGFEVDLAGAMRVEQNVLTFQERTPTSFDGVDLLVTAEEDATLTVELAAAERPDDPQTVTVSLAKLVSENTAYFSNVPLDDQQNRLVIGRTPGDRVRVRFDRDSLVFAPGEPFTFEVLPHRLALPAETPLRCLIQLEDEAGTELWREQHELQVTEQSGTNPIPPVTIQLPEEEGVYDVVISLSQRRFVDTLVRTPKLLMQRKVQLVVIADLPLPPDRGPWSEVDRIDLGDPSWWERWSWLPSMVSGWISGPVGDKLTRLDHEGQTLLRLAPGQWHAAPLPIARIGAPHMLEIEYPDDLPQTLGISIVEPDAVGQVAPIGLDSGIDIPKLPRGAAAGNRRHRLIFWPRSKAPWMLLTNRRQDAPAVFSRIAVLAGPSRLPESTVAALRQPSRLLAAYYDKPLFPENFSAEESSDGWTSRSLREWRTFVQGGTRLVEYLKHVGYNGAILCVAREGSALYPSQLLEPTPRYDNGTFFVTGQDPLPKDVLELLFRLFDREGMTLIPAVHFSTPLPELENMLAQGGPGAVGLESINGFGAAWHGPGPRRGEGPHYNPLDPRVQQAVGRVVDELADRYAHHPSFGGVSLQIAPTTFVQLPDEGWGFDDRTVTRFQQETKTQVPGTGPQRFAARAKYLLGTGRAAWLEWRAEQLAELRRQLQQRISSSKPDARLFLVTADMLKSWSVQREMHPQLLSQSSFAEAMLRHGLDFSQARGDPHIVLLRPQRLAPLTSLASQAVNIELNRSAELDAYYRGKASGAIAFHESQPLSVPEFAARGPFPTENSTVWLASQISPSGLHNRARFVHSIATLDAQTLIDGGWMMPLGQEDAVRQIFEVYRRLPPKPFDTAKPATASAKEESGVVVRTLSESGRTLIYAVNDAPWPVQVDLQLDAPARCSVRSLDRRPLPQLERDADTAHWRLELEAYDLVGAILTAPGVEVHDWHVRVDEDVEAELTEVFEDLRARIDKLAAPPPLTVLENPDFEVPPEEDEIPGWKYSRRAGVVVEVDEASAARGQRALHFKNELDRSAWVRSKPVPLPRTGRIAIRMFVRTADPDQQPPLRAVFDLEVDGRPYENGYLYKSLGVDVDSWTRRPTGRPTERLSQDWPAAPLLIYNNELPVGQATHVLVGFDLMGKGEVWIDDVQVFDLHFDLNEQTELLKKHAPADAKLQQGRLAECQRYLDGYWPRFLMEFVPEPPPSRVTRLPDRDLPASAAPSDESRRSLWNRLIPKWPLGSQD